MEMWWTYAEGAADRYVLIDTAGHAQLVRLRHTHGIRLQICPEIL
jgi:hypothetical protein